MLRLNELFGNLYRFLKKYSERSLNEVVQDIILIDSITFADEDDSPQGLAAPSSDDDDDDEEDDDDDEDGDFESLFEDIAGGKY